MSVDKNAFHDMRLTFTYIITYINKCFNSEVAASRSEVMPIGIVKLLLRSSEVKYSAYRAEGTLHARSFVYHQVAGRCTLARDEIQRRRAAIDDMHRTSHGDDIPSLRLG